MKFSHVVFCVLIVFLWGCTAGQSTKVSMKMSRKYNVVQLEELLANPQMFKAVPITFRCVMGRTGNIFSAMNTHFTEGNSINFGVWPEKTKLWVDEEARDKYHPLMYIRNDSPIYPVFRDIKKYEVIEVFCDLQDTYAGQAWIEVFAIQRVKDKSEEKYVNHFTDKSLFYIKNAIEYENEKEYDFAIEDYSRALSRNLPGFARVEILFKQGTLQAKLEHYEKARDTLEQCVAGDTEKKHYKAYALLGEVYRQLKNFKLAVHNAKQALEIKPNYIGALRTYGISLALRAEEPDYYEAERKCRRALKFDPTDPETNYYLGIIYGLQKQYNSSIEYYKIAIDNLPQDFRYHKGLAGIYHKRSNVDGVDPKQSINDKEIALHEYEIVKRILKRTEEEDPDVYYFSGVVQEELGDYYAQRDAQKARSYYDLAKANYEKCVSIDKQYKKCWYELAYRYVDDKEFKKAVKVYAALETMEPESAEIRFKKAVMLHDKLKDNAKALKALEEALSLDRNSMKANYLTGRYLLEKGWKQSKTDKKKAEETFEQSRDYLEKALDLSDRKDPLSIRDLIYVNHELNEPKEVIDNYEMFENVIARGKQTLPQSDMIQVYLKSSNAYKSNRDQDEAAELLKKSLKLDSNNAATHVELAKYNIDVAGDAEQALSHAQKAVALNPDWKSYDIYGWALSQTGKHTEALGDAYAKIDKKTVAQNPEVRFHIGVIYYKLQKYPQAKTYLNFPPILNHPELEREARRYLKEISRK